MKIIYRACMTRIRTMQNRWNYYPTNNIQLMPIFSLDKRDPIIQAKYESWTKIISQIREAIIDLHFFFLGTSLIMFETLTLITKWIIDKELIATKCVVYYLFMYLIFASTLKYEKWNCILFFSLASPKT